ncbi:acyl-CoA dehydrogenase family protein [Stratiformator vulcanicus]|uniref:Acyl-CoA dehydrogenase n=1 Tax=Stratiformator vulcanicus TaxID=2527980 RepID=A0A517QW35_9PLAN|nr:acyl-CoA dehydrogenase family protein [Stratiformator vulcanicus]QDT35780.1 Acyl-CoA dehydrogenase [Stratiformator vulcanicus]
MSTVIKPEDRKPKAIRSGASRLNDKAKSVADEITAPVPPTEVAKVEKVQATSFAGEALKLGGKSDEEVRRLGTVDAADDVVETLFEERYRTANSPLHQAVWEKSTPIELFDTAQPLPPSEAAVPVMQKSLSILRRHRQANTLLDDKRKISDEVLNELGEAGYWGLLIDEEYGGSGATFTQFAQFLTDVATIDPTTAGLASVHGCIGAVDPVRTFGTPEQKERLLPKLASGERLSAFALTEPGAGSDLTALKTTAVKDGDSYVLNGEKLFITNVRPGRMIGVVCLIDDEPSVLVAELPEEQNEHFQLKKYGLYALKYAYNQGIVFKDFRVPAENLLIPDSGDGLTIAYHGLNRGRISLCANAAGTMRQMMADMLPWARYRRTYGEPIAKRELVERRLGHLAGLIVACDALTEWGSALLDLGFRGEMECIVAKVFGSEAQKEAAIELHMKTHGGRSFLAGHMFGDNIHDMLAPCIYEGEGEMLSMAFFKSLVKQHGMRYFEPIGRVLSESGIKQPNPMNPAHAWALKGPLMNYGRWWLGHQLSGHATFDLPDMPRELRPHAEYAAEFLSNSSSEISATMRKHQLKLADRQCRMAELSGRIQSAVVILCTSLYAARHDDELIRGAAEGICEKLTNDLTGRRPSDRYFKNVTKLGEKIADGGFPGLPKTGDEEIMMRYD